MSRFNRWTLLAGSVGLLASGLLRFEPASHLLQPGQPLPSLAFRTLEEGEWSTSRADGRLLVLNFWATWCAPCLAELPSLEGLQAELGSTTQVVAVAVDENPESVRRFLTERAVGLLVVLDPGGLQAHERLGVEALPVTYVVAADGVVREAALGARAWVEPEVLLRLRALSNNPRTAPTR